VGDLRAVPSDGGAWLEIMAGRPVVFLDQPSADLQTFLRQNPVDYVYLGRTGGFLQSSQFSSPDSRFQLVYDQQGVKVFKSIPKK